MTDDEIQYAVLNDEDFIVNKRYDYSVRVLKAKYQDDPIPSKMIAASLLLTEEELNDEYEKIVATLRSWMIPG